ncbi:MAG: AMP-binding protein [Planctomycetes bacterium]|nr:AMP-binding protein [Planctomycetota bacterium]
MLDDISIIVASLILGVALTWMFPIILRPLLWVFVHLMYRFRVYHRDHIPKTGGVLIVCNHVSLIDWLIFWLACPRSVLFVSQTWYYRNPIARLFLSWARRNTIPIETNLAKPHAIADGLKRIAAALDAGRVVVMFPEARLTRTGNMFPFGRGLERVLRLTQTEVAVVPACSSGLWSGFFSHGGGPIMRKLPKAFLPRVAVWFGEPLKKGLTAADYRLAVQEAMADLALRESDYIPLVHRTFVSNATKFRNIFRPCVIDNSAGPARTLSWGKTFVGALCVTAYLRSRLGSAANVGVWMPTSLGGALANLAIAFLGKTSVNLNYTAGAGPVHSAMKQAGLRIVITSKRFLMRVPLELPDDVQAIYLEDVMESVTKWQRIGTFLMVLLLPGWVLDRFVLGLHRHRLDDPLTIVFSSGSTGEPKGVVLTHRNIGHNVDSAIRTLGITKHDRLFGILPFFHSFGYTVCMWAPLVAGCVAVFFPDPRAAKEVGELARTHRITVMLSTATFLRFYIRRCDKDDFRSVGMIICGAEKLPVKLQDEFHSKFGVLPLEGYGCTEVSPVASANLHNVVGDGVVQERNHRGTVGQPIFGVCVKAFEPTERTPLPIGVEGVLCIKGPNVMAGYLLQPEKTTEAIRDRWYSTGDIGFVEADGFIRITGRMSRFAKIAGEMVPLERLDEELHDVLGSNGERVLAVASVPDEKRGERIVVLHLPDIAEKLPAALESLGKRGLPNLWIPDRRDCYPLEVMPTLGSGKLDMKKLADVAKEVTAK